MDRKTCLANAGCSSRQKTSSAEHDRGSKRNVDHLSEDHCRKQKRLHQPENSIIPCQAGTSLTSNCNEMTTAGRILRVVLKNFMCHEHLRVTFNDRITFVCGKNGSGKSAILTAIVVGLGGNQEFMFFAVTKTFLGLENIMGVHGVLFMYGVIGAVGMVYLYHNLPETVGKRLDEIEEFFRRKEVKKERPV